jgi:hypothetical protein
MPCLFYSCAACVPTPTRTANTGVTFDLSGFKPPATPGYWHVLDANQHAYYFTGCGTVASLSSPLACIGSQCKQPAAIQTWGDPVPQPPVFPADSCAGLGSVSDETCHWFSNATEQGVSCAFVGGDSGRALTINYICSKAKFTAPTAAQTWPASAHYLITFTGPAGCRVPPPPSPPGRVPPQQVTWLYASSLSYAGTFLSAVVGLNEVVGLKQAGKCRIFHSAGLSAGFVGVCDTRPPPTCPDGPEGAAAPPVTYTFVVADRASVNSWYAHLAKFAPPHGTAANVTSPHASAEYGVYAFNFYDANVAHGLGCYRFEVQSFDDPAWPEHQCVPPAVLPPPPVVG